MAYVGTFTLDHVMDSLTSKIVDELILLQAL